MKRARREPCGVIAASGIAWAQIKQIGWAKLRAIARVLNKENNWTGRVKSEQV